MADFKDTIIDTLIKQLRSNLPDGYFKKYYYGDPVDIPLSYLPCVIISKEETIVTHGPTGMDLLEYTINIQLAYNKRNDFGLSDSEIAGVRALEQYAEGRDPTTSNYTNQSVAGILRTNFTLGNIAVDQQLDIKYGLNFRPKGAITQECQIRVKIQEYVQVPNRV